MSRRKKFDPNKPDYKGRVVGKIKRRKGYIYYVDAKGRVIEKPSAARKKKKR